jgi:hypothetical protein
MNDQQREMRQLFIPIAVVERHQTLEPELNTCDMADRIGQVWVEMKEDARSNALTLDADCVLAVHIRIAKSFNVEPSRFVRKDDWSKFVQECGSIDEDPSHTFSWIMSALYWGHLTRLRLPTAWLYTNALRAQHGLPEYRLSLSKLGGFLNALAGSGPPVYDGQTFYPDAYSE